jgi:hypothetical protein
MARSIALHVRLNTAQSSPDTMRIWLLLLGLCGAIGAALICNYDATALEPFRGSFLTMVFAVTTFSVTFSISGFNSSAYRQFHRNLPPRLLAACVALLLIALLPLVVLVLWPVHFIPTAVLLLSILVVAGACLLEISRRETDPLTLLDRLCSTRIIVGHLRSLVPKIDSKIQETKALDLSKPHDQPTHEFDWHLPVPTERDDPLTHLATLGLLAIQHGDLHAFSRVVDRCLEALEQAENFKPDKPLANEYRIRSELRSHVFDVLQRFMLALQRDKATVALARVAIDTLASFAVSQTKGRKQTERLTFSALQLMESLSRHCYESGSVSEIRVPLIVARQLVQKGMDDPALAEEGKEQSVDVSEFHFNLPQLTNVIKRLGSYAVEKSDSELLYRCFDAFGWLGCSAVKQDYLHVATVCLRGLSQLGREARAKDLECFWDRCPVRPVDHAWERIDWICSWVSKVTGDRRQYWVGVLESAYSRVYGFETSLHFEKDTDGKVSISKDVSKKKHIEGYIMQAAARDVDYSDFAFLKDLELHGGRGVVMQGPPVPLFPSESEN